METDCLEWFKKPGFGFALSLVTWSSRIYVPVLVVIVWKNCIYIELLWIWVIKKVRIYKVRIIVLLMIEIWKVGAMLLEVGKIYVIDAMFLLLLPTITSNMTSTPTWIINYRWSWTSKLRWRKGVVSKWSDLASNLGSTEISLGMNWWECREGWVLGSWESTTPSLPTSEISKALVTLMRMWD